MRILVTGGRTYSDQQKVSEVLQAYGPTSIIHGNAAGADDLADSWAKANHCKVIPFYADWGTFGKSAGPLRNKQMLDEGKPDIVIAFPGGKGTKNMCDQARARGIPIVEIT